MKDRTEQFGFDVLTSSQRKLIIRHIQDHVAPKFSELNAALQSQVSHIQLIKQAIVLQAGHAQKITDAMKQVDAEYRKKLLKLPTAIIRLGVDFLASSEIIDVATVVFDVILNSCQTIDIAVEKAVNDMQTSIIQTHEAVLQEAQSQLLQETNISSLSMSWELYQHTLQEASSKKFTELFDKYINSPVFIGMLIDEYLSHNHGASIDEIELNVGDRACQLVTEIIAPLLEKIAHIENIAKGVSHEQGAKVIRNYFQKLNLLQELLSYEKRGRRVSKYMGHQAAKHFPQLIAQKKFTLFGLGMKVKHKGEKVSFSEYKADYQQSPVKLGLLPWASKSQRENMFFELTQQLDVIQEELITSLQGLADGEPVLIDDLPGDISRTGTLGRQASFHLRHSKSSTSSIFSGSTSRNDKEKLAKLPKRRSVVLLNVKPLTNDSDDSYSQEEGSLMLSSSIST